jgi:hypothetical protein
MSAYSAERALGAFVKAHVKVTSAEWVEVAASMERATSRPTRSVLAWIAKHCWRVPGARQHIKAVVERVKDPVLSRFTRGW